MDTGSLSAQHSVNVDELAREKVAALEVLLNGPQPELTSSLINSWISTMKSIVTAADLHRTNDKSEQEERRKKEESQASRGGGGGGESIYADYVDDNEQFHTADLNEQLTTNPVKWTIRVQAFKLVHRLVNLVASSNTTTTATKSPLLRHLPDLIRLSFVAATSPYDDLKVQGFEMFRFLINRLASVEEAEFPGHSILEQYKTQVISALKPAFEADAPPYITAVATQVCCLWICRRLEKDNLQRTFSLMEMTIGKLNQQSVNHNNKLYTESELEQERLDILGSWAQLYYTAQEPRLLANDNTFRELHDLVQPHIDSLVDRWWEALKDYALLILPKPKAPSKTHENGNVYTREVALSLFEPVWPKLILAVTTRLCSTPDLAGVKEPEQPAGPEQVPVAARYTQFICSIIMKELCRNLAAQNSVDLSESTLLSLKSLALLFKHQRTSSFILDKLAMSQEFYAILYKLSIQSKSKSQLMLLLSLQDQVYSLTAQRISSRGVDLSEACRMVVDQLKKNPVDEKNLTRSLVAINNLAALLKAHSEQEKCDHLLHTDVVQICRQIAPDELKGAPVSSLVDMVSLAKTLVSNRIFKPPKPATTTDAPVVKAPVSSNPKPSKKAPKINLKTDFSNFYSAKPK